MDDVRRAVWIPRAARSWRTGQSVGVILPPHAVEDGGEGAAPRGRLRRQARALRSPRTPWEAAASEGAAQSPHAVGGGGKRGRCAPREMMAGRGGNQVRWAVR